MISADAQTNKQTNRIITFFHGTNAVRSVQTHSSPRVSLAREIATLTCIPKKNAQVGVSRLTRRNLPLSLKLSACVFRYHELLFLAIYCLYLWQCGRLVMHLKIEFQIEGKVFLGEREMALALLRMMSGVQNKSPLPPPPPPHNKNPVQNPDIYYYNQ